jgi:hypothetical protein
VRGCREQKRGGSGGKGKSQFHETPPISAPLWRGVWFSRRGPSGLCAGLVHCQRNPCHRNP